MPRFVLLKTVDATLTIAAPGSVAAVAAPAALPAKSDAVPEFVGVDSDGKFSFIIPALDPATQNPITALHVTLYEKPAGGTAPTIPTDPAVIAADGTPLHFEADASTVPATGGPLEVDATDAPEGAYTAALVAEYAE